MSPFGLDRSRWYALLVIQEFNDNGVSPSEEDLARELSIADPRAIGAILDDLVRWRWVARLDDPDMPLAVLQRVPAPDEVRFTGLFEGSPALLQRLTDELSAVQADWEVTAS
jgi:hypothetical protein